MSAPEQLSKKEAKIIMKKYGLRWRWDKTIHQPDIQCACTEWFSNPSYGYVKELELTDSDEKTGFKTFATKTLGTTDEDDLVAINSDLIRKPKYTAGLAKLGYIFTDVDHCYAVTDSNRWILKTYFSKEEFDEFVKDNPQYTNLSFDEYWKQNKFTLETNSPCGHAYRSIESKEIMQIVNDPDPSIAEKVISFGFWQTPNPELVRCPICEKVYSIGFWRTAIPLKYKLREEWKFIKLYGLGYIKSMLSK